MAELKTKKNKASVRAFVDRIEDEQQRKVGFSPREQGPRASETDRGS